MLAARRAKLQSFRLVDLPGSDDEFIDAVSDIVSTTTFATAKGLASSQHSSSESLGALAAASAAREAHIDLQYSLSSKQHEAPALDVSVQQPSKRPRAASPAPLSALVCRTSCFSVCALAESFPGHGRLCFCEWDGHTYSSCQGHHLNTEWHPACRPLLRRGLTRV
jgi:hypothetical protein